MNVDSRSFEGLAVLYSNVARQLVAYERTQDALAAITRLAVEIVPGAEAAGITRGREGRFDTVSPTSELVIRTDRIQYDLMSGPCVDAVLESRMFLTGDLRTDRRWTEFGRRAHAATGVLSMLAVRLFLEDDTDLVAGLNIYSTAADAFEESDQTLAWLLATHGALAVSGSTARELATNLQRALESRTEIGIAMGVLMAKHKLSRDGAFDVLRLFSQQAGRKLVDIATEVADTGELALPERV